MLTLLLLILLVVVVASFIAGPRYYRTYRTRPRRTVVREYETDL